jgi:hypothetical protein
VARLAGGLDPATRRQSIIVAGVLAAFFFGSQILNEALPAGGGEVRPGTPVAIGEGVEITPLDGWVARDHDNGFGIVLEKGTVVLDLYPETVGQNAGDLATAYLDVLKAQATQLTASDMESATGATGSAARFTYEGIFGDNAVEGEVTTLFTNGQGVVADAWAPQGRLSQALEEVRQMIQTIEVKS